MIFIVSGRAKCYTMGECKCPECEDVHIREQIKDLDVKIEVNCGTPEEALRHASYEASFLTPGLYDDDKAWVQFWIRKPKVSELSMEELNRRIGAPELFTIEPLSTKEIQAMKRARAKRLYELKEKK